MSLSTQGLFAHEGSTQRTELPWKIFFCQTLVGPSNQMMDFNAIGDLHRGWQG